MTTYSPSFFFGFMHLLFIPHALYIAEKRAASLIIIIIIIIIMQVAIFGYFWLSWLSFDYSSESQTIKCAPNPDEVNICMVSKAS